MRIRRIGVVGAGTMGASLAGLFAFNELPVSLRDLSPELLERGLRRVRAQVDALVRFHAERAEREIVRIEALGLRLDRDQKETIRHRLAPKVDRARGDAICARIETTTDFAGFESVEFAVEAVFEEERVKRTALEELDRVLPEHAVIGSNTSSLSITRLARGLGHVRTTLVTHFFNPPQTLPLVEVSGGVDTSEATVSETLEFLGGLRNHRSPLVPIRVQESPAFVVNRLLLPILNEACFLLEEGIAGAREIDQAMKAGAGFPMGPFELADWVGLDVTHEVAATLAREFGDPKYRPAYSLRRLVDAGHLGRKTGSGFYEYPVEDDPAPAR
ncbi:MAG: 3-hydroxyacyl-CoA dehydrogenase family protein [Thermoplasmata archaeon]